jgi:RNA polymerase sigma-70 factor (ECF subfamily)
MTDERNFHQLMTELVNGREGAAAEIVEEYTAALIAVARREISPKLARRVDPEDIVQSAYRSFFVRMGRGEYELGNGKELWKLLLTITLNKARKLGRFHHARKRNVASDQSAGAATTALPLADLARSDEPSPEDAAILIDEVSALLRTLPEADRRIIELRLQGYNSVEIAKETYRAERSVRRVLERVEKRLRDQCPSGK